MSAIDLSKLSPTQESRLLAAFRFLHAHAEKLREEQKAAGDTLASEPAATDTRPSQNPAGNGHDIPGQPIGKTEP